MTTIKHLHKYKKVNLSASTSPYLVYRCMKPGCNHYTPIALSEGKMCECYRCGEPMIITKEILMGSGKRSQAKPHCTNCTKRKKNEDVESINEFLSKTSID